MTLSCDIVTQLMIIAHDLCCNVGIQPFINAHGLYALGQKHSVIVQVENLQSVVRDRRANWKQSMAALKLAKESGARITKTSIMLGCGEQPHEVLHAFRTLRENGMPF